MQKLINALSARINTLAKGLNLEIPRYLANTLTFSYHPFPPVDRHFSCGSCFSHDTGNIDI